MTATQSIEALVAANATGAVDSTETEFLQAPVTPSYTRPNHSSAAGSASRIEDSSEDDDDDDEDGEQLKEGQDDTASPSSTTTKSGELMDPPPLDEALVTFLLALVGRFLNQAHLVEEHIDQQTSTPSDYPLDILISTFNVDPKVLFLTMDIYKTAGRVLYYVSASNWSIYYAKIKNAVHILGAMGEGSEINPPEIRLLECSCLTRQRVHTVLSGNNIYSVQRLLSSYSSRSFYIELSPYFLHMKRQGKLLFAKMMRRAIWRWIETYPNQFAEVCTSDNRLLSGSENLFDMCSSNANNPREKAILWPLQTILLVLSQDLLLQAYLDNASSQNRRVSLETGKHEEQFVLNGILSYRRRFWAPFANHYALQRQRTLQLCATWIYARQQPMFHQRMTACYAISLLILRMICKKKYGILPVAAP